MKTKAIIKKLFLFLALVAINYACVAQVGPINIGTIPQGKTLKILYKATVNTGLPTSTTQVSAQGSVSGTNIATSVLTDDPDNAPGSNDPTTTPLDGPPSVVSIVRKTPAGASVINNTTVTYLVTFSEAVNGVDAGDFTLSKTGSANGIIAAVPAGPSATYDVTVNTITGDGTLRLDLNASETNIVDDGNLAITGGFTTSDVYTVDHTAPTVTINQTAGQADPANASPIHFTVTFSEAVTGFTNSGVSLSGTATPTGVVITEVAPNNGTTFDVAVSGMTGDGTVTATVSSNVAADAANNGNSSSISTDNTVDYDATAPTVFIDQATTQADPASSTTIHFTVVFDEAVSGFAAGNVTIGGTAGATTGTVNEMSPNNGTTYDVAVTGMTQDGTVIANLPAGAATDAAGNLSAASTSTDNIVTWISDQAPFVVSINRQSPSAQSTNLSSVTFRIIFSEDVTGVDATDFSLTHTGTASGIVNSVVPVNERTYDVNVNTVTGDGILRLDLVNGGTGIKDKDGVTQDDIPGGFTSGQGYTIDNTAPIVTIDQKAEQADPTNVSPINFTAIFSEAVTDFAAGDVTLSGTAGATTAVVTQVAPMDGTTYNIAVSGMAGSGTVLASVGGSAAHDAVGNSNTASTSTDNAVTYDVTAPSVTNINRQNPATQGTTSTTLIYRVSFTEAVTGVDQTDFAVNVTGNAGTVNVTNVNQIIASTYDVTLTVTLINGAEARLDLKSLGTGIKDLVGNDITTGFTAGQTYILGLAPAITTCQSNITNAVVNQAGCTALQSFGVTAAGLPAPTITYKIGTTVITSPYAFASGVTTVTVTASNGIGSPATCSFTVTAASTLAAEIPNANAYPVGVSANTIYIGWAPASKLTYTASASSGGGGYTYKWTALPNGLTLSGATTSKVQVVSTKTGAYTLTLEITDAYGCKKTVTKSISVVDIRCGNKKDKVTVCKTTKPAGTICIEAGSVINQLNSGGYLGACAPFTLTTMQAKADESDVTRHKLEVLVLPNPTTHQFNVKLTGNADQGVSLRVIDILGRTVEARNGVASNSTLQIGADYRPGIYFLEAVQGGKRVTLKLIKQAN